MPEQQPGYDPEAFAAATRQEAALKAQLNEGMAQGMTEAMRKQSAEQAAVREADLARQQAQLDANPNAITSGPPGWERPAAPEAPAPQPMIEMPDHMKPQE